MPRFENANRSDYREVVPGEVPRDEFLLSRLRQQCLPLPDVETSTVSMQSALGYKVQKYLSGSELRNLTLDYLLSHYAVELDRDEFNSAISSVTSAVLTLRDAPATEQTVKDVMLAIHAYFWLENITAEALLEGFEC